MKHESIVAQRSNGGNADSSRDAKTSDTVSAAEPRSATGRPDENADRVDEASAESFPASDPPSWMGMRVGEPASSYEPK
jgi:hypothetical protein